MNFRIPIHIKNHFLKICKQHNISMASRLNIMIQEFVSHEERSALNSHYLDNDSATLSIYTTMTGGNYDSR